MESFLPAFSSVQSECTNSKRIYKAGQHLSNLSYP